MLFCVCKQSLVLTSPRYLTHVSGNSVYANGGWSSDFLQFMFRHHVPVTGILLFIQVLNAFSLGVRLTGDTLLRYKSAIICQSIISDHRMKTTFIFSSLVLRVKRFDRGTFQWYSLQEIS